MVFDVLGGCFYGDLPNCGRKMEGWGWVLMIWEEGRKKSCRDEGEKKKKTKNLYTCAV
jgi:hypothetical protein